MIGKSFGRSYSKSANSLSTVASVLLARPWNWNSVLSFRFWTLATGVPSEG